MSGSCGWCVVYIEIPADSVVLVVVVIHVAFVNVLELLNASEVVIDSV